MIAKEIRIIDAGPLTTVQDKGRFGYQSSGFSVCGVLDPDAMERANLLVGNDPNEAVLEIALSGITAQLMCDTVIALCGADMSPIINGVPAESDRAYALPAGSYIALSGARSGARAYLAIAGGFDIAPVMGSRSTGLKFSLGGFGGRKLISGDRIPLNKETSTLADISERHLPHPTYPAEVILRVVPGPQDDMFTEEAIKAFYNTPYTVTPTSDRMGIRLDGELLTSEKGTDIISDGIVTGSVQVSSDGKPILLTADHQTTGGYAKIATVISADIPKAGQLMSGDKVRFAKVTVGEAQKIAREKKAELDKLTARFRI